MPSDYRRTSVRSSECGVGRPVVGNDNSRSGEEPHYNRIDELERAHGRPIPKTI